MVSAPTQAELDELSAKERLELLEQRRGRKHQWLNSGVLLVGVVFTGAGLVATALTLRNGQDQLDSVRQQQITDRYSKATEDLGSDKPEVRLGAIYALQRLMTDSTRDRATIRQVLAAYARVHAQDSPPPGSDPHRLAADVQAALSVLTDPHLIRASDSAVDLSNTDLHNKSLNAFSLTDADLNGADLTGADLSSAHLTGAHLIGANLSNANLNGAHLNGADLYGAHLRSANLSADLTGADLRGADLSGADLFEAYLSGADLTGAHLNGADLTGAHLSGAVLVVAHLNGAHLNGATLTGASLWAATLSGADLHGAYLDGANLTGAVGADLTGTNGTPKVPPPSPRPPH